MTLLFQIKAYCRYLYKARHRNGYGIHSPYLFHFLVDIIYDKGYYYCFKNYKQEYNKCLKDKSNIALPNLGTGKSRTSTISSITRLASKNKKDAQLLFRIAQECKAKTIIELGTNLGLTTQLLANCNTKANVYTFEGAPQLCKLAKERFKLNKLNNITLIEGNIDSTLEQITSKINEVDFVFFDANHTYKATMNYFNLLVPLHHATSIFVFDDIHQSKEMETAWNEICQHKDVSVSLDLFKLGIILFNKEILKQNRIVSY